MPILQRYTRRDFEENYASGLWTRDSLIELVAQRAAASPDRLALVDGASRLTRSELADLTDRAAHWLWSHGVRPGDIVATQLPNCFHIVAVNLALLKLGAIYHPINTGYRFADILKIIGISRPAFYIHPKAFRAYHYAELVSELRSHVGGFLALEIDVDQPPEHAFASPEGGAVRLDDAKPDPDAIYLIGATSGSTGDPKLFMHSQNTQFNEARALNAEMGIGEDDCFLAFAPITHRGVFMWGFCQALAAGAPLVLQRVYDPAEIMHAVDRERVTSLFAIPTQIVEFLDYCDSIGGDMGGSLRVIMMAGAPVQPDLVLRIKSSWSSCTPITGYGTSETGYAVLTRPDYPIAHLQTCGKALRGMEVAIDRTRTGDGEFGELVLRGAFNSAGYFADQSATDAAYDRDGWFHTGDVGFIDEDGNVVVTGRIKNVIIRSGLKIQAEEVEEVLLKHEAITHAIVVGVDDFRTGERAVACITCRDGAPIALSELLAFLDRQGVAKFKWPEKLIVLQDIPTNAAGKFDRIRLREMAAADA